MADDRFRRLPGRSGRWFAGVRQVSQLWVGDGCLLHVTRYGYSESVKRFDMNDIQMVAVFRTQAGARLNAFFVILIAAITFGFMGFGGRWPWEFSTAQSIVWGVLSAAPGLGILINAIFGPTCRSRLITAVQIEDLPCLRRLRTARRTAQTIRELVETVQGSPSQEQLDADNPEIVDVTPAAHELK